MGSSPTVPTSPETGVTIIKASRFLFIVFVFILVACSSDPEDESRVQLTPLPTATATLRSTPLPLVASPVSVGVPENPIQIAVLGEPSTARDQVIINLQDSITEELSTFSLGFYRGIAIEFTFIETREQALQLLCGDPTTAIFVDIFTFMAAERLCGAIPAFQVERDGDAGTTFELAVNSVRVASTNNLRDPNRHRMCVISMTERETFVHPMLAMRGIGADFISGSHQLVTVEDDLAAVQGLQGGGNQRICESVPLPVGRFDEIVSELEDDEITLENGIELFEFPEDEQWPLLPYEVLVFPPANLMPEFLREEIITGIEDILSDEGDFVDDLSELLEMDDLTRVEATDYDTFRAWLASTGWDMASDS